MYRLASIRLLYGGCAIVAVTCLIGRTAGSVFAIGLWVFFNETPQCIVLKGRKLGYSHCRVMGSMVSGSPGWIFEWIMQIRVLDSTRVTPRHTLAARHVYPGCRVAARHKTAKVNVGDKDGAIRHTIRSTGAKRVIDDDCTVYSGVRYSDVLGTNAEIAVDGFLSITVFAVVIVHEPV